MIKGNLYCGFKAKPPRSIWPEKHDFPPLIKKLIWI